MSARVEVGGTTIIMAGVTDDAGVPTPIRGRGERARRAAIDDAATVVLNELVNELAQAPRGLRFIYDALDAVVAEHHVRDAIAVIELPDGGRQAFRAGRRPIEGEWAEHAVIHGSAGIHTDPTIVEGARELAAVAELCAIAMRLELLEYDSLHDPLTGLYNRRSFEGHLHEAIARTRRYGWAFSLILFDLDQFKNVNDRYGHAAGDLVLRTIGSELRRALRRGDIASRIGGDEFALLLPDTDKDFVPLLVRRLRQGISTLGFEPPVGFSVGVASCPGDADDFDELMRLADERLYAAKARS